MREQVVAPIRFAAIVVPGSCTQPNEIADLTTAVIPDGILAKDNYRILI